MFQNPLYQRDHFRQNSRPGPVITLAAYHRLKSGRQKALVFELQLSCAGGAHKQVRKDPGQTQHPHFEVARGKLDWTSLFESYNGHAYQSEDGVLRLALRQKSIDKLHNAAGTNGPVVILEELHGRIQEIGRLDPHQVPVLLLEELDPGMRQRLQ